MWVRRAGEAPAPRVRDARRRSPEDDCRDEEGRQPRSDRSHDPARQGAWPEAAPDLRDGADRDRRHRRQARRAPPLAGKRAGRVGRGADPRPLQGGQHRGQARADRRARRPLERGQLPPRRHRRPVLRGERGADGLHRPGDQGRGGHGLAWRGIQATHQPLQLPGTQGGGAQDPRHRPAGDRPAGGDRSDSGGRRRTG